MKTPQSQGQTTHKETPNLFRLRGTLANTLLFYRKDHFKPLKRDFNV